MAFDEAKVKLIIEASTEAAARKMREFTKGTEQGLKDAEKSARSFGDSMKEGWAKAKSYWVEITAAVLALRKTYQLASVAASYVETEDAFRHMAASIGADADRIIADMKRMSKNQIDNLTLIQEASTNLTMGLDPTKLGKLMEIAEAVSDLTGRKIIDVYESMTTAIATGQERMLRSAKIVIDAEAEYDKYAETIHKTASELNDAERSQALMNATIEAGDKIIKAVGKTTDSAADKMAKYEATWKNISITIGKIILSIGMAINVMVAGAESTVWRAISALASGLSWIAQKIEDIMPGEGNWGKIAKWAKEIEENSRAAADEGIKQMAEAVDAMTAIWQKSQPTVKAAAEGLKQVETEAKKTGDAIQKIIDLQKSEADTRAAAAQEMYNDMGLEAEGFYREEVNNLVQKVKTWQDAGVSIGDSNKYLYEKIEKLQAQALEKGNQYQADWLNTAKWHTQELVNDLTDKQNIINAEIEAMRAKVTSLDGTQININARLYDDGLSRGLDDIIGKLRTIISLTAQAGVGASVKTTDLEAQIAENIKYGMSDLTDMLE